MASQWPLPRLQLLLFAAIEADEPTPTTVKYSHHLHPIDESKQPAIAYVSMNGPHPPSEPVDLIMRQEEEKGATKPLQNSSIRFKLSRPDGFYSRVNLTSRNCKTGDAEWKSDGNERRKKKGRPFLQLSRRPVNESSNENSIPVI